MWGFGVRESAPTNHRGGNFRLAIANYKLKIEVARTAGRVTRPWAANSGGPSVPKGGRVPQEHEAAPFALLAG